MGRFLKGAVVAGALALVAVPGAANAQLVSSGTINLGGTGLGSVATILTVKSPGSSSVETGCVSPAGHTLATCGFEDATVQSGQTQVVFLSALSGVNGSNLGVVLNFDEPTTATEGQLDQLVLQLYNAAGTSLFTATLGAPVFYATTEGGTGSSGYLFTLSAASALAFNTAVAAGGTQLGLGSSLSQVTGGQETFFIGVVPNVVATPEPASMVLLGTGLVGVFGQLRRRRQVA